MWPLSKVQLNEIQAPAEEQRRSSQTQVFSSNNIDLPILRAIENCSTFGKAIRSIAFVRRFIKLFVQKQPPITSHLSIAELREATNLILQVVQRHYFSKELDLLRSAKAIKSANWKKLSPFLDQNDGLVRVGGRLANSDLSYNQKHPILLPDKQRITVLIIDHFHKQTLHAGPQLLLSSILQYYWPINGRNQARSCVRRCVKCFKTNPRPSEQIMGNLPAARITPSPPFMKTGCDYCGPMYLNPVHRRAASMKVYLCIFVCFSTKAAHIEIVGDLSTASFLAALHRFVSRRGRPTDVFSDNGSTFLGAANDLHQRRRLFDKDCRNQIATAAAQLGINWHFIPPISPHFGGLWEACVKSAKTHIVRVLQDIKPTREELETLVAQVEACLNSRPSTPQYDDPNDGAPLTPGHFLIGRPLVAIPEPDFTSKPVNRLTRWQHMQQALQHFWRRWSADYLQRLQSKTKWPTEHNNIRPGQIVLMKNSNLPPLQWPLAMVLEAIPGRDGKVRAARVKTVNGEYLRNIRSLCVLPIDDNE